MDLIRELRKLSEGKTTEDLFVVNLWGYHLTITAMDKGKLKLSIYCCVCEEVLRFSPCSYY